MRKKITLIGAGQIGGTLAAMLGSTRVDGKNIKDLITEGKLKQEKLNEIVERN